MTNEVFTDKRLLGALDYIDERFIAEVTESYTFEAPGEYKRDKKTVFKAYRQFAALAACLLLISAAFPIVNYVLPRLGISIGGSAGAGTSEEIALNYTAPFGEVPEEFRRIVEQNLFYRATVYRDRLIKIYKNQESENSVIELLTFDGETVAKIEFPKLTYGYHRRAHMTDDGNLLVVFGLGPVYPKPMNPYYPPATIIKIDLDGNILNEIRFDEEIETAALEYCFSTPEGYVLVGQVKKKDAPARLYEYDLIVTTLDKNLNVTNQLRIGEDREHNNLSYASYVDGCLHVWKRSLIDTGEGALKRKEEFSKFVFDSKLDLIEEIVSDERIDIEYDIVRDESYNKYSEKANLDDACGYELIEYADFDLIVAEFHTASEHKISLDSNDIDPINLYRETVYSAYSKNGDLLWRASVDSTDYELLKILREEREEYESQYGTYEGDYGSEGLQPIYIYEWNDEALVILLGNMSVSEREEILASLPADRREKVLALMAAMTE